MEFEVESILHQLFIANKNGIKWPKINSIKRYLVDSERFEKWQVSRAFYNLKNWGIIENKNVHLYGLTAPILLKRADFLIGINLTEGVKSELGILPDMKSEFGLSIIEDAKSKKKHVAETFDSEKILKKMANIKKLIANNCHEPIEFEVQHSNNIYDPEKQEWKSIDSKEATSKDTFLLKLNLNQTDYFYDFIFKYKKNFYRFKAHDVDQVNLIKLYLSINVGIKHYSFVNEIFKIKPLSSFPTLIERVLSLTHILNTGKIAINREYVVGQKCIKLLQKILSIT